MNIMISYHRLVRTFLRPIFGFFWRYPVIMLMWTPPVVVIHQVITDIPFRLPHAHISHSRNPLRFKTSEQPLHRGVIPTVATPTHALGHAIAPQSLPKCPAAISAALVGVKQYTRWATSLLIGHLQRFDCQLCTGLSDIAQPTTRRVWRSRTTAR